MQKVYQLYDSKSETYSFPTHHPARGQAIRSFGDAVNAKDGNVLATHSEDFTLFEIGDYDIRTGEFKLYEARVAVVNGVDVKVNDTVNR